MRRSVKTANVKLTRRNTVCVLGAIFAATVCTASPEDPTASPAAPISEREDETKEAESPSPDGKFAFLIGRDEDQKTVDLIDATTEKVLQHIDDSDIGSVSYSILWALDSKRFALMTRAGHPNQDVRVYLLIGDKFHESKIPDLTVEIPTRVKAGKPHPHVAANNWEEAEKWNEDGSLVITVDNTIDGAGHTATATRTVLLAFDKSGKAKILKSSVKYQSRNDDE